ncbi:hypothetical protein CKO51_01740 [Rhodopirellula sp. SM50]|nr:hypothetical protein CKO51_01740 [Rhodopirellula sp. SM50]
MRVPRTGASTARISINGTFSVFDKPICDLCNTTAAVRFNRHANDFVSSGRRQAQRFKPPRVSNTA